MEWVLKRHKDNPAVVYWMRPLYSRAENSSGGVVESNPLMYEIRSPVNALGLGSETLEEGLPGPDLSARSGYFSAEAVERYYEEVKDDEG